MAVQEQTRRLRRADRFPVSVGTKRKAEGSVKRSRILNRLAPVGRDQISDHIARWLIRDGECLGCCNLL
jgi:hypothetical protein